MTLSKLTMLSAVALLAGGMSIAAAETNRAPATSGTMAQPPGQCGDTASHPVKDTAGPASGATTPGRIPLSRGLPNPTASR